MRAIAAILSAAVCLLAAPAFSQDFSAEDRAAVEQRVADLQTVVESGDPAGAMDVVPPRLYRYLGQLMGATEAEARTAIREAATRSAEGSEVVDYIVALDSAEPRLTPDGSRTYLLIPTTMRMRQGNQVYRSESVTLAFEDEGRWGLIRIADPQQVELLVQIWPEFAGVDFPRGTIAID